MYRTPVVRFAVFSLLGALAAPEIAEASFAKSLSRSYGGTLSSNTSTKTQQLTSDPAFILAGSVSTTYNPAVSSLLTSETSETSFLVPGPSFDVSALVGYRLLTDPSDFERLASDSAFFEGLPLPYVETGYVQVTFFRKDGNSEQSNIEPLPGYEIVDTDGFLEGDDTHALLFDVFANNPLPSYTVYAEDGSNHDVFPDYLTDFETGETFFTGITPATVSGAVPEPASAALLLLAGGSLMRRRRAA